MNEKENIPKSCMKVGHYIDRKQYNEVSFWEHLHIQLHIINCARCRQYKKWTEKLSSLLKKSKIHALKKEDKTEIKNKLKL